MKERTIIIYHDQCPDGFGGAWTAWKKFGGSAEYRPMRYGTEVPADIAGAHVILIDFSYPAEVLKQMETQAASLLILDHHEGAREDVESVANHVFDNDRSGAALAWEHFRKDEPMPKLLSYIEDGDLWRFALPFSKEITAYLSTIPFNFEKWDVIATEFEDEARFSELVMRGRNYLDYLDSVLNVLEGNAELVEFEGRQIYAVNAPRFFRSELGNRLAKKQAPFAIVWYYAGGCWHCSLRGDGTVDLSEIAKKYGGNGHHNAASFNVAMGEPFPFKKIQ